MSLNDGTWTLGILLIKAHRPDVGDPLLKMAGRWGSGRLYNTACSKPPRISSLAGVRQEYRHATTLEHGHKSPQHPARRQGALARPTPHCGPPPSPARPVEAGAHPYIQPRPPRQTHPVRPVSAAVSFSCEGRPSLALSARPNTLADSYWVAGGAGYENGHWRG